MTQPGAVRVTVARVCPACEGKRTYYDRDGYMVCPRCRGKGVVWEPVTCDDCAHSAHAGPNLLCDLLRCRVDPDFACQSWEPLMVLSEARQ